MNARIIKITVFLLFAATLVCGSGIFSKSKNKKPSESWTSKLCSKIGAFFKPSKRKAKQKIYDLKKESKLKPILKHVEHLMYVEVLMKFKMISAKDKKIKFEQASINSDMHFVKYGGQLEILGTENYRPGHTDGELNKLEKQFLIDFAAQHEPLNQYNFAADWYFFHRMLKKRYRNTSKLCVVAKKVDSTLVTGKVRDWDNQNWNNGNKKYNVKDYDPYKVERYGGARYIDFDLNFPYDNVIEMLLRNGEKLILSPNQLSSALWVGQKSTLYILQKTEKRKEINVNEQLSIGFSRDTAFEFAVRLDMLLVVDEMLKNHNPKLDKLNQMEGSTILHLATTYNMLRLLVKALKAKCLLKTILKTRDAKARYSYQKQELFNNKSGSDFLRKEYSELPLFQCFIM